MCSARSAIVTSRFSIAVSGALEKFSIAWSMRVKASLPCDQIFGGDSICPAAESKRVKQFGVDDDMLRRGDVYAMGEGAAAQIGIDQRHHAAD